MKLSHRMEGDSCVVAVVGSFAGGQAGELKSYMLHLSETTTVQKFALSLKAITKIDSTGLGSILSTFHAMDKKQLEFVLCDLMRPASDMLEAANIRKVIKVYNTEAEALAALE